MTSLKDGSQPEKLSFAKIAAAGLKHGQRSDQASRPANLPERDGDTVIDEVTDTALAAHNKQVAQQPSDEQAIADDALNNIHLVSPATGLPPAAVGSAPIAVFNETAYKPPSMDGKSTASVTTFAMDEKESIQPDDSASMAAVEDEHASSPADTGPVESSQTSNEGVRAFQEQLNEIAAIEPLSHPSLIDATNPLANPSPLYTSSNAVPIPNLMQAEIDGTSLSETLPDAKLLEALENPRDRIWVLKLEQDIIDFVKDAKEVSLNLPQCNSFYRMLAHKIGDYYMLGHALDESNASVRLFKTPSCRIPRPLTGVITPSTAASTPPPSIMQMKILRRGVDTTGPAIANGSNGRSKNTSENGESGNEEEVKKAVSREEREARYEAARLRIMGSARPSELSDPPKDVDESRSSSAAGKRKKKQRDDSNDDFEARSAYNSYMTPSLVPNGSVAPNHYAFAGPQGYGMAVQSTYSTMPGYQQAPAQPMQPPYWYQHTPQAVDPYMAWPQSPQQPYDISREFDRALSFQSPPAPTYVGPQQQLAYDQQPFATQPYVWSPQNAQAHVHPPQSQYGMHAAYNERPASEGTTQQSQPYAYGKLPSQALGRPPNALEHPLPGSYKRHFNPQSNTFVPGHGHPATFSPFASQESALGPQTPSYGPGVLERQSSSHSQASSFDSSHRLQHGMPTPRMNAPSSLTHPLPQPVFASQQLPSTVLPPKPQPLQQSGTDNSRSTSQTMQTTGQNESTIAKWGAPASLPAKPPPPVTEPFDVQKLPASPPRATSNVVSPRMPIFGSMPPA